MQEIVPSDLRQTDEAVLSALAGFPYKNADAERTLMALHEAGHAVIAAVLRVPFSYVTIKPNAKDNSGGHVSMRTTMRLAAFRWTKRGKGDVFTPRSEDEIKEAISKADYKKGLAVIAARAAVERRFGDIGEGQYAYDEKELREIFLGQRTGVADYEVWHSSLLKRAKELVATPYIAHAIFDVLALLYQKTTLKAKEVRDVVRLERWQCSEVIQ